MSLLLNIRAGLAALLLLLMQAFPAQAAPHVADFALGMPKSEMEKRALTACGGDLCGEVNFGGQTWSGLFRLDADSSGATLGAISLRGALSDDFMEAAFLGIEQSPYVLIYAETSRGAFSFARLAREGKSAEDMEAEFKSFLGAMPAEGNAFATYVYALPETFEELKKMNPGELPRVSPKGCICTLHISAEGVAVLIGTVSYLADHMPAALPLLREEDAASAPARQEPDGDGENEER